ncbi:MAG: hypothetical protein E7267_04285 [Lachnospiraceae bacterium]|nr:hypothetical protein [Lachnospiraceae bacterium]
MYIKLTGIFIVLLSTCSIGYIMGERARRQLELLSSLRRCLSIIESEVRYMGTEIGKIYEIISDKNEEWSPFFREMASYMNTEYSVKNEYVLAQKMMDILPKEDKDELVRFVCEPCGHDRQKELGRINVFADRLDARIKMLESDVGNRIKLMRMLGLSSGIFLILLII